MDPFSFNNVFSPLYLHDHRLPDVLVLMSISLRITQHYLSSLPQDPVFRPAAD